MFESPVFFFEIDCTLTVDEALNRLGSVTERPAVRLFGNWGRPQKFEGFLDGTSYDLHRIVGRDSFNPRVRGEVATVEGRTVLSGTMTLDRFVTPFLTILSAFLGVVVTATLVVQLALMQFTAWTLIPVAMLTAVLIVALKMPGFVNHVQETARALSNLVSGTRVRLSTEPIEGRWKLISRISEVAPSRPV